VVYSQPGETLGEARFVRLIGHWTMPCIVSGPQIDAEGSQHGFDLLQPLVPLERRNDVAASALQAKACAELNLRFSRCDH
jgi:hypothetical protein